MAGLRGRLPELVLVCLTVVWGTTFLIIQTGLAFSGPFTFLGARFGIAAALLAVLSLPALRGLTWREVRAGAIVGTFLVAGFAGQTVGLMTIDSSMSAFLTALYVPLVPLMAWGALRRPLGGPAWVGTAMATAGLVCLSSPGDLHFSLGFGEGVTLASAFVMAAEILLIGALTPGTDPRRTAIVQLVVAAAWAFGAAALLDERTPTMALGFWLSAGALGVASAFIQAAMNWAQKTVSATRATVIYTLEPVWAGLFGRLAGERIPAIGLVGAALIVASVLVSELWPRREAPAVEGRR